MTDAAQDPAEEDLFKQEVEWQLQTGEATHVFFDKADLGNFLFNATNEMAGLLLTDPFTESKMAFPQWKILRVVRWRREGRPARD